MKVYKPAKCKRIGDWMFDDLNYVIEEKYDGSRYLLYLRGAPKLLSRRISIKTGKYADKTLNVPQLTKTEYSVSCVLDGEVTNDKGFSYVNSIMNSLPDKAIDSQSKEGLVHYIAFDILELEGTDLTNLPLYARKAILYKVIKRLKNSFITSSLEFSGHYKRPFHEGLINKGKEGTVLKDIRAPYGKGWYKAKPFYDVSGIVTGYLEGRGKYESKIGSLIVSVYNKGELVEAANVSGFSDELRQEMTLKWHEFKGRVVDIQAQEFQKNRLRHPSFVRFRDDINKEDCTLEKLKQDLKLKNKGVN